jgi:DNA-binding GntR family transcriptional regulator
VLPPGDGPRTRDLDEHRQMMDLVISGDGERAAELMRNHIRLSLTASAIEVLEAR